MSYRALIGAAQLSKAQNRGKKLRAPAACRPRTRASVWNDTLLCITNLSIPRLLR